MMRLARPLAAQERAALDVDGGDLQLVDVGTVVVLGIGDGGFDHLANDRRGPLRAELQHVERSIDGKPAHLIRDQSALLGRQAHAP